MSQMSTVSGEYLSKLVEIGFIAGLYGEHERAAEIFSGLDCVSPDNPDIKMGLAVTRICSGQITDAIHTLEHSVLSKEPNHTVAQCFLAWACRLQGDDGRATAISTKIHENDDPDAIALLKSLQPTDLSERENSQLC